MFKFNNIKSVVCLAWVGLPFFGGATCLLHSHIQVTEDDQNIIPEELLNLTNNGTILEGFKRDVTITDILKGEYDTLKIPKSVEIISDYAFSHAFDGTRTRVANIILNDKLTRIGKSAFSECPGIQYINFEEVKQEKNYKLNVIGDEAFLSAGISTLIIPDTVTYIGSQAFRECVDIEGTLKIPNNVKDVGRNAFAECSNIWNIDLTSYPEIPKYLYEYNNIFYGTSLDRAAQSTVEIRIDGRITSKNIWVDAILNRQYMATVPGEESALNVIDIYEGLETVPVDQLIIEENDKIKTLKGFKEGIDLSKYNTLNIPNDIDIIDSNAFCPGGVPQIVTFPMTLSFETRAGEDAKSLKINNQAFFGCSSLCELDFGMSKLEEIGDEAFSGTNISTITIPSDTIKIGARAFANCFSLKYVSMRCKKLSNAGDDIFANCPKLDTIGLEFIVDEFNKWPTEWDQITSKPFRNLQKTGFAVLPYFETDKKEQREEWMTKISNLGFEQVNQKDDRMESCYWLDYDKNLTETSAPFPWDDFHSYQNGKVLAGLSSFGIKDWEENGYENLLIDNKVIEIQEKAFASRFQQLLYHNLIVQFNFGLQKIGDQAFKNGTSILWLSPFPKTLEYIGSAAFMNCQSIRGALFLPNSLKHIGSYAFANCSLICGSVDIFENVQEIGSCAFNETKIERINFHNFNGNVSDFAFNRMDNLTTIDFTSYNTLPTGNWSSESFNLPHAGKVLVKTGLKDQWTNFLTQSGLLIDANHWQIEEQ